MNAVERGKCNGTLTLLRSLDQKQIPCFCSGWSFATTDGIPLEDVRCGRCGCRFTDHGKSYAVYNDCTSLTSPQERLPDRPPISPFNLDESNTLLDRRETTCEKLYNLLLNSRIIHARGTPTSGKTSLKIVFANYVNKGYPKHGKMAMSVIASERTGGTVTEWLQS